MKIAIISHTEHYKNKRDTIVGWGPTIKELNNLLEVVDEIIHLAPLHDEEAPKSATEYNSSKITFVPLKKSGGKGLKKLSILFTAPYNLYTIYKNTRKSDYIQFRAPTGMGIYVLPFLKLVSGKNHWVKYAGNWKDERMPIGNKLQKKWLQKCTSLDVKITVNGKWENERANILAFENPCLDDNDRELGKQIISEKKFENTFNFCFVGALNYHKGVDKIINAFSLIEDAKIGELHFVGDGPEKEVFKQQAQKLQCKTIFHGFLPKEKIYEIYAKSHFILLPSKSEGFPKVIGEAMNYGCIPIVSDVSCINQYISNKENGFLIQLKKENDLENILKSITQKELSVFKGKLIHA